MKNSVGLIFSKQLLLRWRYGYSDSSMLPLGLLSGQRVCINSLGLELLPNWLIQWPLLIDSATIANIVFDTDLQRHQLQHTIISKAFITEAYFANRMASMPASTFVEYVNLVLAQEFITKHIVSMLDRKLVIN